MSVEVALLRTEFTTRNVRGLLGKGLIPENIVAIDVVLLPGPKRMYVELDAQVLVLVLLRVVEGTETIHLPGIALK
jgi:hypothetical protein